MKKHLLSVLMLVFATSMFAQTAFMTIELSSQIGYADEEVWLVEDATEYTAAADMDDSQKIPTITDPATNVLLYALTGFADYNYAGVLAIDNLDGVQLGFVTNTTETNYKLIFTTVEGTAYNLIDKYLGTSTLIEQDGEYPFSAPAGKQIDNRFEIRVLATVPGLTLNAHEDPEHAGDFYCTFFHSGRVFKLPAGAEAYVGKLPESFDALNLTKVADPNDVIPAGVALILKANSSTIELATTSDAPVAISAPNDLLGKDYEEDAPAANCYVFSGHSTDNQITGIGFYQYEGAKLGANKAYIIAASANAPRRLPFVFAGEQGTTAIGNVQNNVQCTKVIENGVLVIKKNGERYNAMGQIVK